MILLVCLQYLLQIVLSWQAAAAKAGRRALDCAGVAVLRGSRRHVPQVVWTRVAPELQVSREGPFCFERLPHAPWEAGLWPDSGQYRGAAVGPVLMVRAAVEHVLAVATVQFFFGPFRSSDKKSAAPR